MESVFPTVPVLCLRITNFWNFRNKPTNGKIEKVELETLQVGEEGDWETCSKNGSNVISYTVEYSYVPQTLLIENDAKWKGEKLTEIYKHLEFNLQELIS